MAVTQADDEGVALLHQLFQQLTQAIPGEVIYKILAPG